MTTPGGQGYPHQPPPPPGYGYPVVAGHPAPAYTPSPIGHDPETGEPVTSDQKTKAVLAQILALWGGFLPGLILRLTTGKRSSFVRAHATESLNVALSQIVASVPLVLGLVVLAVAAPALDDSEFGAAEIVLLILLLVGMLIQLFYGLAGPVLWIVGAIRAAQLRPPPRPGFILRLVKDKPSSPAGQPPGTAPAAW